MKFIIFGVGRTWEKIESYIPMSDIVAFTDNNRALWGNYVLNRTIIPPAEIKTKSFDRIVIVSEAYQNDIRVQLAQELKIEERKILSWERFLRIYLDRNPYHYASVLEMLNLLCGVKGTLLDVNNGFVKYSIFSKTTEYGNFQHLHISGIRDDKSKLPLFTNIYDTLEDDIKLAVKNHYQTVLCCDLLYSASTDSIIRYLEKSFEYCEAVLFNVRKEIKRLNAELEKRWNYHKAAYLHSCIYIASKRSNTSRVGIYVVAHKQYQHPTDRTYIPIHVGSEKFYIRNMVRDDIGDNIAYYNNRINECTAMYWIWKHSKYEYVGLNHYRRYFLKGKYKSEANLLDETVVVNYLSDHDIILSERYSIISSSVGEQLETDVGISGLVRITRDLLAIKQPEYIEAFDYVFSHSSFYRCNLFVTRKSIFDQYCEWLFSFLLFICDEIDVSGCNEYQKRAAGFIAERMLTVWLLKTKLRIKELPFLLIDE